MARDVQHLEDTVAEINDVFVAQQSRVCRLETDSGLKNFGGAPSNMASVM
jgi:hypothetical protein